jgi:hypothetical protein
VAGQLRALQHQKGINMCRRIRKSRGNSSRERVDPVRSHQATDEDPPSDRTIVLRAFADLTRSGLGALEEIPDLGPQFFSLHSGEVFWLGADEITRIK